ncbi:MAG: class I SAM-dependent methyltransferase [Rhizorhabdus sp.]
MTLPDAASAPLNDADEALAALLRLLREQAYRFVSPTPATHARVLARPERQQARSLRDVLGWSLPYRPGTIDREVEDLLEQAGMLDDEGAARRSRVRVSSLRDTLFLHSAYPTADEDAVFFGPDSYRFADLIAAELNAAPPPAGARLVDLGTGSGVGGIVAATACPWLDVALTDLNPKALRFARINARAAGVEADLFETRGLATVPDPIDLISANPPYIIDSSARLYRDGGGMHGGQVSLDMAREGLARLAPGGRLILYTGSAIVDGADPLRTALEGCAADAGCTVRYRELDPDVFGEELEGEAYREVERIALVAAVIVRR